MGYRAKPIFMHISYWLVHSWMHADLLRIQQKQLERQQLQSQQFSRVVLRLQQLLANYTRRHGPLSSEKQSLLDAACSYQDALATCGPCLQAAAPALGCHVQVQQMGNPAVTAAPDPAESG